MAPNDATTQGVQLSERDREILRDIIDTYLLSGEPVSSRRVAKTEKHELSAASIRNVMADLEDLGFLSQPHTSAGRVPTSRAYHFFIDALMKSEEVGADARRMIERQLTAEGSGDELASSASRLLSTLSQQIGVVVIPAIGKTILRSVEFVPLSGCKVLCVVLAESGFVEHKLVQTDREIPRDELVKISNYLTDQFSGWALATIRDHLLGRMHEERVQMDHLLRETIELASKGLEVTSEPDLVVDGTDSLVHSAEPSELTRVKALFQLFSEKASLVSLLNMCVEGEGVRVFLGEDTDLTSEIDMSLVVRNYGTGSVRGSLGIVGPARMNYSRVIPLVDFLGDRLSEALAKTV